MDPEWSDGSSDVAMESPTETMIAPYTIANHRVQPVEHESNSFVIPLPRLSSPLGQDASQMARALVRADAAKFFADNLEDMANFWTALLDSTCLPRNIFCPDAGVTSAFRSLDKVLSAENSTPLAIRLAFVQLPRVFNAASSIIATAERQGTFKVPVDRCNNNLALDLYSQAQGKESRCTRNELDLRRRLAQRWVDISSPHPLLLVTYTGEAEKIISNFAVLNRTLQAVAAEVVRALPAKLIQASTYFTQATQISAGSINTSNQEDLKQYVHIVRAILSSAD